MFEPGMDFPLPSAEALAGARFVLADIDDTITTDGRLTAAAYAGLERLSNARYVVVLVTGRPAGWCDLIARFWPVDGVVGENGAFYFRYDRDARCMRAHHAASEAERAANRGRLDALAEDILAHTPGAALASDQAWRIADLAIDISEDVAPLPAAAVDGVLEMFARAGAVAKLSSIHVNGWFGAYDKLSMAQTLLREEFGQELPDVAGRLVYVGDSPNDEPMFRAFPLSVGVANVRQHLHRMEHHPRFITKAESGAGFVELVDLLIAAREAGHE